MRVLCCRGEKGLLGALRRFVEGPHHSPRAKRWQFYLDLTNTVATVADTLSQHAHTGNASDYIRLMGEVLSGQWFRTSSVFKDSTLYFQRCQHLYF